MSADAAAMTLPFSRRRYLFDASIASPPLPPAADDYAAITMPFITLILLLLTLMPCVYADAAITPLCR